MSFDELSLSEQEKIVPLIRRFRIITELSNPNTVYLVRDMNMLWKKASNQTKIAETGFSRKFTSKSLVNWLRSIYPEIKSGMNSRGFQWVTESEWNWFLSEISKSIKRRSGVVFIARKKVLFVQDNLVLKINNNNKI